MSAEELRARVLAKRSELSDLRVASMFTRGRIKAAREQLDHQLTSELRINAELIMLELALADAECTEECNRIAEGGAA